MAEFRKAVAEFVKAQKQVSNKMVCTKFGVAGHQATKVLAELVAAKRLKKQGHSAKAIYITV